MFKLLCGIVALFCVVSSLSFAEDMDFQLRAAAFHPQTKRFREVYSRWGTDYEFEFNKRFCGPCGQISGWFNVNHYTKKGHSLGVSFPTRITIIPFSIGGKYFFCLNSCWQAYVGAGLTYTCLKVHDHAPFAKHRFKKQEWGCVAKLGMQYNLDCLLCGLFVDLFADYYYLPFHFHHRSEAHIHNVNVGGLHLGLGIGYRI